MKEVKISIVIGLGFGDEGKGNVVNALADSKSIVVRFNGGHQAGHTVVHDGYTHIFSTIGSGALKGASTYLTKDVVVNPIAMMNELKKLNDDGYYPTIFVNGDALVTLPMDIERNINNKSNLEHGTVGVGFGETIRRNEEDNFSLKVRDLKYPSILNAKLQAMADYYKDDDVDSGDFYRAVEFILDRIIITDSFEQVGVFDHVIFEGAQGTMLDKTCGIFPNVTRGNTIILQAIRVIDSLIKRIIIGVKGKVMVYYVTRAYTTRHGNGYMPKTGSIAQYFYDNSPTETNRWNKWQGHLRKSLLSLETLKYALECNRSCYREKFFEETLVVTCVDQLKNNKRKGDLIPVINYNDSLMKIKPKYIARRLRINNIIISHSVCLKI